MVRMLFFEIDEMPDGWAVKRRCREKPEWTATKKAVWEKVLQLFKNHETLLYRRNSGKEGNKMEKMSNLATFHWFDPRCSSSGTRYLSEGGGGDSLWRVTERSNFQISWASATSWKCVLLNNGHFFDRLPGWELTVAAYLDVRVSQCFLYVSLFSFNFQIFLGLKSAAMHLLNPRMVMNRDLSGWCLLQFSAA